MSLRRATATEDLLRTRLIETLLDREAVEACARRAVAGIPDRKGVLGASGHRAYTAKSGRFAVGFGFPNKQGQMTHPRWAVEFSADGRRFDVTLAYKDGRHIKEEAELRRFLDAFAAELAKADPTATVSLPAA